MQKAVLRTVWQTKGLNVSNILVIARSGVATLAGPFLLNNLVWQSRLRRASKELPRLVRNDLTVRAEGL